MTAVLDFVWNCFLISSSYHPIHNTPPRWQSFCRVGKNPTPEQKQPSPHIGKLWTCLLANGAFALERSSVNTSFNSPGTSQRMSFKSLLKTGHCCSIIIILSGFVATSKPSAKFLNRSKKAG